MASTLPPFVQRPKPSLIDLSPELLALIFEQLRIIGPEALITARLLSHRFNAIGIPIQYRTVTLTATILQPDAEQRWSHVLEHVYAYTQDIITSSDLDPGGTKRIFDRARRLRTVRWRYVGDDFRSGPLWMPSDVLSGLDLDRAKIELHIDGLPLRHFEGTLRDTYIRAIPADLLVSLRMAHPTPPLTTRLASLKQLLLRSRRLLAFHYRDRGQGTYFAFAPDERFPAFRELSLKSYDWRHDGAAARRHWDFSRLESLELISVPIFNFLSAVPLADLSGIQTLRVEDFSAHLPDRRQAATRRLHLLVKDHIRALYGFEATCHTSLFQIDALLAHASTLGSLRLNDHVGFAEDDRLCPTLQVTDVEKLAKHCTKLHTLELDLDTRQTDVTAFLRAISAFPRLDTITLHVPTGGDPNVTVNPTQRDANLWGANDLFDRLEYLRRTAGSDRHWKSVTINLGGWRPVMIRRLSERWLQLNRFGIFAEQCFRWTRAPDGSVSMEQLATTEAHAEQGDM